MAGDITFGIRLTADAGGFTGTVRLAGAEVERLGKVSRDAGSGVKQLDADMKESMRSAVALGTVIGQFATEALRALGRWAAGTVTAAAELKNLSDITGSTVESLSQLTNVAKVSGFEGLNEALGRLSVGLSGTDEESQKAGKALAALGVQSRDPARAMQELAQKFSQYKDDVNKAAYAVAIFGRGGEKLLPLLKDLVEQQGIGATVTRQQAEEAERLEKNLRLLTVQASAFRDELLSGVVPALNAFFRAMHGEGVTEKLALFSISPDDRANLEGAIAETKAAFDQVSKIKAASEGQGLFVRLFQSDDIKIANEQLDGMAARLKELNRLADIANPSRGSQKNADRYLTQESIGPPPGSGARAKKEVDEYAKALTDLAKQAAIASDELDAVFTGKQVVPAMKALLTVMNDPTWGKFTAAQQLEIQLRASMVIGLQEEAAAVKKLLEETKATIEADEKAAEARQRVIDQRVELVTSYQQANDDMRRENDLIGQSELAYKLLHAEMESEAAIRKIQGDGSEEAIRLLKEELEARKKLITEGFNREALDKTLKEQQAAFKQTYENIRDGIADSLVNAWSKGESGAKAFIAELKTLFANLVLRPIVQAVVSPIAGGLTSLISGGAQAAAGGGGGVGGIASNLSSLSSLGSLGSTIAGIGTAYSAGAAGISAAAIGASEAALFGGVGAGAAVGVGGIGAGVAAGLAAVPVAGWIGLAALAAFTIWKKTRKKPKTGGFGESGVDVSRLVQASQGDANVQQLAQSLQGQYEQALDALGGTEAAGTGFALGYEGRKTFSASAGAYVGGQQVYSSSGVAAGKDEASIKVALELEGKRAILAALQASDIPKRLAEILNSVAAGGASSADIDKVLALAQSLKFVDSVLGPLNLNLGQTGLAAGAAAQQLIDAAGGADQFAAQVDAYNQTFMTAGEQLDAAFSGVRETFDTIGQSMPTSLKGFRDLVQSLDLTTDAGRSTFSALMNVAPAFASVTNAVQSMVSDIYSLQDSIHGVSGGQSALNQLNNAIAAFVSAVPGFAPLLAQMGTQGFAANLANIMPSDLANYTPANVALIQGVLSAYNALLQAGGSGAPTGVMYPGDYQNGGVGAAVDDTLEALKRLRDGILEYVNGLKISDLSPLTPAQKLAEARGQYESTLSKAQGGDQAALGNITGAADAYLKLSRDFYASSAAYTEIFNGITGQLTALGGGSTGNVANPRGLVDDALYGALPRGSTLASAADIQALSQFMQTIIPGSGGRVRYESEPAAPDMRVLMAPVVDAIYDAAAITAKATAEGADKGVQSAERSRAAIVEAFNVGRK